MTDAFQSVIGAVAEAVGSAGALETGKMFGSVTLKRNGKVFAMEVKGNLVVKLAEARAASLVASGTAVFFDPGHGRPSRQWVSVPPASPLDWRVLAMEAFGLVTGTGKGR